MDRAATGQDHDGHGSGIFYLKQIANSKFHRTFRRLACHFAWNFNWRLATEVTAV
jgi:hypothetical protein